MFGVRADSIMSTIDRQPGSAVKVVQIGTNDFLPPAKSNLDASSARANVSLSSVAREIATILQRGNLNPKTAAAGFDAFIQGMHKQLSSEGKDAAVLKELPASSDPGRLNLAKQAANYLLTAQYGSKALYDDASSDNPFSNLDRKSLSALAFDDSGAFTSAERQVAFFELSSRDVDFTNKVFDTQPSIDKNDGVQTRVTSLLADASLASAMSAAELAWRGWPSSNELAAQAAALGESSGKQSSELPAYQNLKGSDNSVLAAVTDKKGLSSWQSILVKDIDSKSVVVSLMDSLDEAPNSSSSIVTNGSANGVSWISLYKKIDDFGA